jgi:hypothetical protein
MYYPYIYTHFPEAVHGGKAVFGHQKSFNFRDTLRNGSEHDGAMGNGFVAGHRNLASKATATFDCYVHGFTSKSAGTHFLYAFAF